MLQILYRASFFLYELSFIGFALALGTQAVCMRRVGRALRLRPYWLLLDLAALLLLGCALVHFYVYHYLSPIYLASGSREDLFLMYWLKTGSMAGIFLAGFFLLLGGRACLRAMTR